MALWSVEHEHEQRVASDEYQLKYKYRLEQQ
jgi:hypothetical protein